MARKDEQEIDNLFQLPLDEFTAARNALAKQAGKDGGAIRALSKPPVAAWAINQLYWRDRATYDALVNAATELRKAHKAVLGGRAADLRATGRAHDAALDAALKSTLSLLSTSGHPATDATRQAIVSTLRALPSDEPAGRLTRTLQPGGFEALSGFLGREGTKTTTGRHEEAKGTKATTREHEEAKGTKATTGKHEEAKKAKETKKEHEEAKAAKGRHEEAKRRQAEREAAERQARERVRKEVAAATEALRRAEQEARREEFERARAARDAEKASVALQRAREALERAQEELEEAERAAASAAEKRKDAERRAADADEQVASAREQLTRVRSNL